MLFIHFKYIKKQLLLLLLLPQLARALFGPDLYQALRVLGFFASLAADGTSPDWLPVAAGNPKQL